MEALKALLKEDPELVLSILSGVFALLGVLLKAGVDLAREYLKLRSQTDVQRLEAAIAAAKLTPGTEDDVKAEMALKVYLRSTAIAEKALVKLEEAQPGILRRATEKAKQQFQ